VEIAQRIAKLLEEVENTCQHYGSDFSNLQIVAVSKSRSIDQIKSAHEAGMIFFGENRVQEAQIKHPQMPKDSILHMIGHLQKNKVTKAVRLFQCVQSVDSTELAMKIAHCADTLGSSIDIMLELHTGEGTKSGYQDEQELTDSLAQIYEEPAIRVVGLMTMAPFTNHKINISRAFSRLATLFSCLRSKYSDLHFLSMGMSRDYHIAIAEGGNMIRIGNSIFGPYNE